MPVAVFGSSPTTTTERGRLKEASPALQKSITSCGSTTAPGTREELTAFTLRLANQIAQQSLFTLKLVKEAVNAAQDAQGRPAAMSTSFAQHQLSHTHNLVVHGALADPALKKGKSFGTPKTAGATP